MSPAPDSKMAIATSTDLPSNGSAASTVAQPALLLRGDNLEEPVAETPRDARLDRMPMQLDVMVRVRAFCVEDLLAMEKGTIVQTVHEHTQDVPIQCGGVLLVWGEFEVVEQKLAVRITRLA